MSNYILTKKIDRNLLNYSDWVEGYSGSTTDMNLVNNFNTINSIERQLDPFGNYTNVWKGFTTTGKTNAAGGWTSVTKVIDTTKTYRCSLWVKQTDNITTRYDYFGIRTFNNAGTQIPTIRIDTGASNINQYPCVNTSSVVSGFTQNEWRLYIGYIYPTTWTGTTSNTNTGILKPDGTNLGKGNGVGDLKFSGTSTKIYSMIYAPYKIGTDGQSGLTNYNCYPRIDLIDGSEPSIDYLLKNEGQKNEISVASTKIVAKPLTVGESYGGGTIGYIDATGIHGLIYGLYQPSIFSPTLQFGPINILVSGTTTLYGSGRTNTNIIIAKQIATGQTYAAASYCTGYTGGGFTDWFLPSINELSVLPIGIQNDNYYWSSTELSTNTANSWYSGDGPPYNNQSSAITQKNVAINVIPMRYF